LESSVKPWKFPDFRKSAGTFLVNKKNRQKGTKPFYLTIKPWKYGLYLKFYFNRKYSLSGNAIQSAACFCAVLLLLLKLPKTGTHEKPTLCAYHKPDFSSC